MKELTLEQLTAMSKEELVSWWESEEENIVVM